VLCYEQYDGQTSNEFSVRCSSHSSAWNKPGRKGDKDQMALLPQYSKIQD